jgi:hypothetical protein
MIQIKISAKLKFFISHLHRFMVFSYEPNSNFLFNFQKTKINLSFLAVSYHLLSEVGH